jgi:hypothetical protein
MNKIITLSNKQDVEIFYDNFKQYLMLDRGKQYFVNAICQEYFTKYSYINVQYDTLKLLMQTINLLKKK